MSERLGKARVLNIQVICPYCNFVTREPPLGPSGKWATSVWLTGSFLYFAGEIIECSECKEMFRCPEEVRQVRRERT